jgi:SAM-dependent methyltransferase
MDVLKEVKVVASKAQSLDELYENGRKWVDKLFELGIVKEGDRVLDFGAGVGRVSIPLKARGCIVTAVERRPNMVRMLRDSDILTIEASDMSEVRCMEGEELDLIIASYVFQHQGLSHVQELVAQASELSNKLLFTIPTFEYWKGKPPYKLLGKDSTDERFEACEESFVYYEKEVWSFLKDSAYTRLEKIDFPNDSMYLASRV